MRISYVLTDYLSTLIGVVLFNVCRFFIVPGLDTSYNGLWAFMQAGGVKTTLLIFPPFMLLIYYLTGYYVRVYNKSRIVEFAKTLIGVFFGSIVFFLVVLLNDLMQRRISNYEILLLFATVLFVCVYVGRVTLTNHYLGRIRSGKVVRKAVLITDDIRNSSTLESICRSTSQHGIKLTGIMSLSRAGNNGDVTTVLNLPVLTFDEVSTMTKSGEISCVVLSADSLSPSDALAAINKIYSLGVTLFVSPDMKALVMGSVRFTSVMSDPLVNISRSELPDSVVASKRFFDIILSATGLLLSLPVIGILAVIIKIQSPGPVIYSQERVGYKKRIFTIHKLRSMYHNSEPDGPLLSSVNDGRITQIGKVMRKYRLDELPNLWNVLKGDMSIVGPRPERPYYVERIVEKAPHYTLVHQLRPGLTSWGMVKFGYAVNIDEMVERLKYDLLYLQNVSLSLDLRILYHTFFTVMRGEGK